MTTETKRPSIRERIRAIDAGEPVIAAHFLKDEAALLLASGEVVVAGASDRRISLHEGGILDSASDGAVLVTGGDDGRVVVLDGKGEPRTVHDSGGTWIDRVAVGPRAALPGVLAARSPTSRRRARRRACRCPPPAAASPSSPRASAWRSPTTTARRSGIRMSPASRRSSNGRARISASR